MDERHGDGGARDDGESGGDFERRARERLLESAERLDGATRSRLTQARHAALEELEQGRGRAFRRPALLVPAGALAAGVVAALVWVGQPGRPGAVGAAGTAGAPVVAEVAAVEDLELLAANDEPELYADDAAFYEWAGLATVEDGRG
jgi:hypothetical protein